jgi:hypothetical protein
MKIKHLYLFLLLSTQILIAQTDYRPGYIIKSSGDTIFGEIDYRSNLIMSEICKFKTNGNTIQTLSPEDIKAFRFNGSKYFVSKKVNDKNFFLEYLIKGKMNVYYLCDKKGDHYFLDKEGEDFYELPYEEGIKYVNNKKVYYETKKHVGFLNYFMKETPSLRKKINELGSPSHKNLIKLAEDYHNLVCDETQCVVYETKQPFFKVNYEIISGFTSFSDITELNKNIYYQSGIITHIWMPKASEKVYFKTGIVFTYVLNSKKEMFYKIPIQIEYVYPKGIFRPTLSYGVNFNPNFYPLTTFDVGVNISIVEHLLVTLGADADFFSKSMLFPGQRVANSFRIGILLDF